jgi:UDP-N-acetylglucosamine--N-acetylmuramyl-(pentapeptide) pyrophosphoryl-undecaprenol N-acetylglucosamine transferase
MLVFGGSQGARAINGAAQDVMKLVCDSGVNLQIIHILGDESLIKEYEEAYQAMNVCCSVKGFEDKMAYGWVAADFVLCRAGAASIAELLRFEVPAILVPFPKAAEDHQLLNAQELMNLGLGVCIEERELNFHTLFKAVSKMLDVSLYRQMKEGMKAFKEKGKAENLCQLVESFIQKQKRGIYE